jgi:TolA-binding protein
VQVNLSSAGVAKSASTSGTSTTDQIKVLEKRIQDIQKQITQQQVQLAKIQSSKNLTADQKQTQASAIQSTVGQLSASLSTANAQLVKLTQASSSSSTTAS